MTKTITLLRGKDKATKVTPLSQDKEKVEEFNKKMEIPIKRKIFFKLCKIIKIFPTITGNWTGGECQIMGL